MEVQETLRSVLSDMSRTAQELGSSIDGYCDRVVEGVESSGFGEGLGILDVKSKTFLSYLCELVAFMAMKVEGKSIEGHPLVDALVESRVVLEKMRPIEETLKYQIEKIASLGSEVENRGEEAQYAANLSALVSGDEASSGAEDGVEKDKDAKYRPPRVAAVRFTDAMERAADRDRRRAEREIERARKTAGVRELFNEVTERPIEIKDLDPAFTRSAQKLKNLEENREHYEEDYFVRTTVSKKERKHRNMLEQKSKKEMFGGSSDLRELVALSEKVKDGRKRNQTNMQLRDQAAENFHPSVKGTHGRKKKSRRKS